MTRGLCIAAAGVFIFNFAGATAFAFAFVAMSIAAAGFFILSSTFAFVAMSFFTGLLARGFVPSLMGSASGVASSDDFSAAGAGPSVGSRACSRAVIGIGQGPALDTGPGPPAGAGADPCTAVGILFGSMRGPSWFCSIWRTIALAASGTIVKSFDSALRPEAQMAFEVFPSLGANGVLIVSMIS